MLTFLNFWIHWLYFSQNINPMHAGKGTEDGAADSMILNSWQKDESLESEHKSLLINFNLAALIQTIML